jgi:hypothetical protein
MIIAKICVLEHGMANNSRKLKAIKQLKEALEQIDFNSEFVPLSDYQRLVKLFESLLKRQLNQAEIAIIEHLIEP